MPTSSIQSKHTPPTVALGGFKQIPPKSLKSLCESTARINIWHGAVRSAKTVTTIFRFYLHIRHNPGTYFLITGKTERTIKRNIINDFIKICADQGVEAKYNRYDGEIHLLDKVIYIVGLKDEGSTDKLRGMTVSGWLGDEITTCPESAVTMAISRCSTDGAEIYWTTNPDSPYHFIFTDYIDNDELKEAGIVKEWLFQLEDNPYLPQEYIDDLKRTYKGVFYKRYILGLWVLAEGAIYDMFLESENTFESPPFIKYKPDGRLLYDYDNYVVGIDYATATVCVFGLFGLKLVDGVMHYHLIKEWYYDAVRSQRQMTDGQYADEMVEFIKDKPVTTIFSPHDATSLTAELRKRDLPVRVYTPDVINDIKKIQVAMEERRFMISEDCKDSVMQAQTYVWDEKKQELGIDVPKKKDDHCPDMWRGPICGTGKGNRYAISKEKYDYSKANEKVKREYIEQRRSKAERF